MVKTRKELRVLKRKNAILDIQHILENQIQEKRLHVTMAQHIGNNGIQIMTWTSMIVTFMVLTLMFIDLSGPRED